MIVYYRWGVEKPYLMRNVARPMHISHLQHTSGLKSIVIAAKIGRSVHLVRNCIERSMDKPPGVNSGRKRKLGDRDDRHIADLVANEQNVSGHDH
ncbi:hypothetical protein EON65_51195 [archaeon]|nr:MAG: hypothetical protein EON65_51195 [archaeon]